jgi:GNAT superfamily N-acetyltransferase
MTVTIARATIEDLDALLPLVTAYRVFYHQEPDAKRERAFLAQHLETETSTIFIAWLDGNAAGFAQLFQTFSTVRLGPSLILEDLYVVPAARGAGVAGELLARASDYARDLGATGMFLETATDNLTAQRVYERAGWRREAQFYKYNATL